jgi:hypothetical protein
MAEEKKEKWTTYLAITTVVFAVCATLSTFKGGGFGTKSLMNQAKASDQWSYFQGKSTKSYLFELQKERMELDMQVLPKTREGAEAAAKFQEKINKYDEKIKQYEKEKEDIKKKAEDYESEINNFKAHSSLFGMAVIFLQVAILLSSIAALMKKQPIWFLSLAVGAVGIFFFIDGFMLFWKV